MRGLSLVSSLLVDIGVYFGEVTTLLSLEFLGVDFSGKADFRGLPRGFCRADFSGASIDTSIPTSSS